MIKAVMFDMGGTLEDLYSCEDNIRRTAQGLVRILRKYDIAVPYGETELWEKVYPQILAYKAEAEITLMELKPEQLWPDYGFRGIEIDREKLIACSEEIAHMWEVTYFDRKLRQGAAEMLKGLKELGFYVAAVSNTASVFQVFSTLEEYGVRQYFDDITLSSVVGYRKPHPCIFKIALCQGRLRPGECAFVGDTVSRDVVGPRKVGYGRVFKIGSFLTPVKDVGVYEGYAPDYEIEDIYDVYTILKREREQDAR
ncbi:MAG TPA: HAD family hydrolase [Clostridia bacterium]|nr:HAD family hydrolase [Clostridia bacterium]